MVPNKTEEQLFTEQFKYYDSDGFGECNLKTLHKRLINNNISLDKLCEIIKEYKNGN